MGNCGSNFADPQLEVILTPDFSVLENFLFSDTFSSEMYRQYWYSVKVPKLGVEFVVYSFFFSRLIRARRGRFSVRGSLSRGEQGSELCGCIVGSLRPGLFWLWKRLGPDGSGGGVRQLSA